MLRIAVVITHPIQYYAPIFRQLSERGKIELKVFYTWGEASVKKMDPGFGKIIEWDIPLLDGYTYEFLENIADDPGSHHYKGIDNPEIINRLTEYNPDKILIFGWNYMSHLKVMKYFKGKVPIYFRGDSHLLNHTSGIKQFLRFTFLKWVYSHIDYAIAVGANNRAYYKKAGLKESQIKFAPHAIDEKLFEDTSGSYKAEAFKRRKQLGIPEGHTLILYAGKFEAVKNLNLLMDAFAELSDMKLSLLLVGNGEQEELLKERAGKNIYFIDFQNQQQIPVIYRMADIFCLPSKSETWGLSVNEAMNCSCAILVSDKVGCAVDLVHPGENGYIFELSISDLKMKIELMISDTVKLKGMGEKSKEIIREWSMDILVSRLENILCEVKS